MKRRVVPAVVAAAALLCLTLTGCGSDCPKGQHDVQTGTYIALMPIGKSLIPMAEPVYSCESN